MVKDMGNVIWITGLSSAGKTTLAKLVTKELRSKGLAVVMLDGDDLRNVLNINTEFSKKARLELAFKYSRLSRMISLQGTNVVVGTIALFKEIHHWNRQNIPSYYEVYLKVPITELRRRDPKGIYKRFDAGTLQNVAGLDLQVDEPFKPDLVLDYHDGLTPEKSLKKLMSEFYNYKMEENFEKQILE